MEFPLLWTRDFSKSNPQVDLDFTQQRSPLMDWKSPRVGMNLTIRVATRKVWEPGGSLDVNSFLWHHSWIKRSKNQIICDFTGDREVQIYLIQFEFALLGSFLHDVTSYLMTFANVMFLHKYFEISVAMEVQKTFENSKIPALLFFDRISRCSFTREHSRILRLELFFLCLGHPLWSSFASNQLR